MAFREVHRMQVIEVIRRWQAGDSQRGIARAIGLSRNTVDKYIRAAQEAGVRQDGEPPGEETLRQLARLNDTKAKVAAPQAESLRQHHERITGWMAQDMQLSRIHELLAADGVEASYTTLRRYVREAGLWKRAPATMRMAEWPPGEVAEMDFGRLGVLVDADGKKQVVWALVVVLPYSRHQFVWPLTRQTLEETIAGLEAAWAL